MKTYLKTNASVLLAALALATCQVARADILTVTNDANVASWDAVGGNAPFYSTSVNAATSQGAASAGSPSTTAYVVMSETFTITNNGAGGLSVASAASNYVLNAISFFAAGGSGPIQVHLFDVTTNLSSNNGTILNGSGATYGFLNSGDLFGNGLGLTFNNSLPSEKQEVIVLQNGPESQDQVVLGVNHTYALEFWIAATNVNSLFWYRGSVADPGGQGMGSHDGSLATNRLTMASLGQAGGAPRTFAVAFYGAPTTNALSVNTDTNLVAPNAYTVDDYSTNGVSDLNPAGDDYFPGTNYAYNVVGNIANVYKEWFGDGGPNGGDVSVSFNPNVNISGNTNSNGALQINFTWNAATDGYQQWLLWRGNANTYVPTNSGGSVGVGYPQYTNIECDVKFDPSSVTNTNGVYGVIRLMARGVGDFGQPWIPTSYTTITDTNWHHINGALLPTSSDALNIGDIVIGEDVTAYVGGGGLTGNQIMYVDNVRITGPAGVIKLAPPTVAGPMKVTPSLRLFAGPSSTIDRTVVYTVDQNQSWVGATAGAPVSYSFSLLDYNPNIQQVMIELMGDGTTPTTYGEFADYSGPTTLWLAINPGPAAGEVVANVAWKITDPNANPTNTATSFTNSTAIGTWSLVFTSPTTGYVVAPGHVINGSKNFTIIDPNTSSDFANPVFAAFGEQPNTGAGQGAYEDIGFIGVTNVPDGNEFEDFTKESSDFVANYTPSVEFNNGMSELPAAAIIQTTNDAYWINWTQPAINFTLASATNLNKPNWINPGWYSAYSDTNAPRVMPLTQGFNGKFWVLLPKDDVPTANGQQNSSPPAASAPAPDAFFVVSTNTVSP
jgi:hypothetical protein